MANHTLTNAERSAERKANAALMRGAESGDAAALVEMREQLPIAWDVYGDLVGQAEGALLTRATGEHALHRAALTDRLAQLRAELAGPSPAPVERLLVERVALCWLAMYYEDAHDAQQGTRPTSWAASLNRQRRAEVAQRRFLAAVRTLETVRRLAGPVIQVNVGAQQVNVGNLAMEAKGGGNDRSTPCPGLGLRACPQRPHGAILWAPGGFTARRRVLGHPGKYLE